MLTSMINIFFSFISEIVVRTHKYGRQGKANEDYDDENAYGVY